MAKRDSTPRWLPHREINVMAALLFLAASAHAQEVHRHHPPADVPLHERFYSTWYMPDQPTKSCCNKADCYPTIIEYRNGMLYARRREDGTFIHVPVKKIEQHRDSPDGRNHLCAPPPEVVKRFGTEPVFCFVAGDGA